MIQLYLQAPFAACRSFTAGWHRPSATFLTPSAIYGLLLNIAGIETRIPEHDARHDGSAAASLMRTDLPPVTMAIGSTGESRNDGTLLSLDESLPQMQSIFQQLHNYPVGKDAGMPEEMAKGNKNNISPVRREFLSNLRVTIQVSADKEFEEQICRNLTAPTNLNSRYGLPFLGDNQFLIDRLEIVTEPIATYWYVRLSDTDQASPGPRTVRLTTWIDRADMARTISQLYAPTEMATVQPPDSAWTKVGPKC